MAGTSFKIRGIEPPDLAVEPAATRKMFWEWVVELGLKRKSKEILEGLDKDGKPLRPIKPETAKRRKSSMTPSGKGAPTAPPLVPGYQKSRTYSLLAGRAFTTHAEFYWRFDAWTGESWGEILKYQAEKGRDVIGISPDGLAWVKVRAWQKWAAFKEGRYRQLAKKPAKQRAAAVPRVGRRETSTAVFGMSASGQAGSMPTLKPGQWTGGMTPEEWERHYRGTASARPPGRPGRPASKSDESGPGYNRLIRTVWGQGPGRGGSGRAAIGTPRPAPKKPVPTVPTAPKVTTRVVSSPRPAPTKPSISVDVRKAIDYGREQGYELELVTRAQLTSQFKFTAKKIQDVPLFYHGAAKKIYINQYSNYWKNPLVDAHVQGSRGFWASTHPLGPVDHEIGHAKHHEALGSAYFAGNLRTAWDDATAAIITQKVSRYAATSRVELVAEVYTGLKSGKVYDDEIMTLYRSLGGVLPND
jgi:hypothetical protein